MARRMIGVRFDHNLSTGGTDRAVTVHGDHLEGIFINLDRLARLVHRAPCGRGHRPRLLIN